MADSNAVIDLCRNTLIQNDHKTAISMTIRFHLNTTGVDLEKKRLSFTRFPFLLDD